MVYQRDKQRSIEYLCNLFENTRSYNVRQRTERFIELEETSPVEHPRTVRVVLANFTTADGFEMDCMASRSRGTPIVPVLYKDGKTAFVRMVDRNLSWRSDKSLKHYTLQDINRMLHLRKVEKTILYKFDNPSLYYQPETALLKESVRAFRLAPVDLDYSHIGSGHPSYGFVQNHESIDYKLPEEVFPSTGLAGLMVHRWEEFLLQAGAGL